MLVFCTSYICFPVQINEARRKELGKLRNYAVTDALLFTFWEIVPAVVGASAFVLHTFYLGEFIYCCVCFLCCFFFSMWSIMLALTLSVCYYLY